MIVIIIAAENMGGLFIVEYATLDKEIACCNNQHSFSLLSGMLHPVFRPVLLLNAKGQLSQGYVPYTSLHY